MSISSIFQGAFTPSKAPTLTGHGNIFIQNANNQHQTKRLLFRDQPNKQFKQSQAEYCLNALEEFDLRDFCGLLPTIHNYHSHPGDPMCRFFDEGAEMNQAGPSGYHDSRPSPSSSEITTAHSATETAAPEPVQDPLPDAKS